MKRFFLVMFGLALVAVCAGWFLGALDGVVQSVTGVEPPANELGTSSSRSARRANRVLGGLDLNTVLNVANALIGFAGLLVTYKASRGGKSDTSSA